MKINTDMPDSQLYEISEDIGSNHSENATIGDIIAERMSRRDILKGALATTAVAAIMPSLNPFSARRAGAQTASVTPSFTFEEIAAGSDETHHVADGYDADVLIRWGDKVLAGAPAFDPKNQTPAAQAMQFGYNSDFVGFVPLDGAPDRGLLVVNHEYTNVELMFPGGSQMTQDNKFNGITKTIVDTEMMAHGGSVVEVRREGGKWRVLDDSPYARRITAETEMRISGPASAMS